jgi:hypothetical protein
MDDSTGTRGKPARFFSNFQQVVKIGPAYQYIHNGAVHYGDSLLLFMTPN